MSKMSSKIRMPNVDFNRKTALLHTTLLLIAGLLTGIVIKYLDIYTSNLGNIFSQMSVWIFICTLISVLSYTPKRAAINVFLYCIGMLATYYIVAESTDSVYSMTFVYFWFAFALCTPIMSFITWYARGKNTISNLLTICIVTVTLLIAVVIFDRVRFIDIVFTVLIIMVLRKR